MGIYYVDTSAIVKRYHDEAGTQVVDDLLNNALPQDRFYTSFLSVLELTSAIARLTKGGQLTEDAERGIMAAFRRDLAVRFRVWPMDDDIISAAVSLVERHRLRSGDALHLASAIAIFSMISGHERVLVSSDHELVTAANASGIVVLDPLDSDSLDSLHQLRSSER